MRGPNYKSRNANAIKRGFKNFGSYAAHMEDVVMRNMARDGLFALLREHNLHDEFLNHPQEKDTLAYALAHDGMIIESGYHNGKEDDLPGDALNQARQVASAHKGWCAVILSDMQYGWYSVVLEEDLLNAARGDIEDNYSRSLFGNSEYFIPGAIPKPS